MFKTLVVTVTVLLLAYVLTYAYLFVKLTYVWQCRMYTGEQSIEAEQICSDYRAGKGLYKLL